MNILEEPILFITVFQVTGEQVLQPILAAALPGANTDL